MKLTCMVIVLALSMSLSAVKFDKAGGAGVGKPGMLTADVLAAVTADKAFSNVKKTDNPKGARISAETEINGVKGSIEYEFTKEVLTQVTFVADAGKPAFTGLVTHLTKEFGEPVMKDVKADAGATCSALWATTKLSVYLEYNRLEKNSNTDRVYLTMSYKLPKK